ncbi:penicillin acylase family protein [Loktanella sp. SALINAS62]|uniref:penicillin acylase family protein n=1 Tax=Loktanella sp. SALINAS62 TaxID=2706124 RepID=UPI001B8B5FD7|nr:penicillin acylase family protein [Loktanella sp. SALINAS62]MBS1303511.1 penicillin acylase family protein [Loktanella sp. SALINAS62]
MAIIFRWLLRLTTALFVLSVATVTLVWYFASRSLPDHDGTFVVQGVSAPVEVVRDNAAVPHIFGETDADTYFALGYVHAQDRLWQMTMLRRTAQGRLSELFGQRTVSIDNLIRRLDLYGLAVSSVAAQDTATRTALDAYADGVNAWLDEINAGSRGRGAPEMWVFNHAVAPWQPADSIAILKIMALQLSGQADYEVLRARTSLMVSPERLQDILPDDPSSGIAALPEYSAMIDDVPRYTASADTLDPALSPLKSHELSGASNAWAAGLSRSAAGSTLLANDPHLGLTAPTIWYLTRLQLQSGDVIGATIPGLPVVLTGRSSDIGWGVTTAYVDDQDVHLEQVNPDNPNQYRTPDGWADFRTRESIVRIKDAPAITLKLRWTENGPVLPGDVFDLGAVTPAGHVAALSWTALSGEDTSVTAAMRMMAARTVEGAIDAAEGYLAPAQNLTLADRTDVALKTIGAIPRRDPMHRSQGRMPSYGYVAENRWQGRMPYADNPEFIAPEGGILGNTNNKTVDRPFPNHVSFKWGDTQRINRWRRLMQSRQVHTRDSFIEAQLDTVSFTARSLLPLIGADLWFTGEAAPDGTPQRRRQIALELLANWNGEMNEHLPEPLIYAAWLRALQTRLIQDDLGPLETQYTHPDPVFIERVFRDVDGASVWCDVIQSAPTETCTDIARMALDDALQWIDESFGKNLETLRWGDMHQATHDHPVLGDVPVLQWFVNIRQSTSGGDNTLMRGRTAGEGPNPFRNVHAAGYRGVYDFADPDSSVFVTATGQSGHFLSRYYDNLGELWRRGEYIPMSLDPDLARAAALGVMMLQPQESE